MWGLDYLPRQRCFSQPNPVSETKGNGPSLTARGERAGERAQRGDGELPLPSAGWLPAREHSAAWVHMMPTGLISLLGATRLFENNPVPALKLFSTTTITVQQTECRMPLLQKFDLRFSCITSEWEPLEPVIGELHPVSHRSISMCQFLQLCFTSGNHCRDHASYF